MLLRSRGVEVVMVAPLVIAAGVGVTTLETIFVAKYADGKVEQITEEAYNTLIDEGVPFAENLLDEASDVAGQIGAVSLQFVEGLGTAIFRGAENTYDYLRGKLRGKEPDVIAGFTSAALVILAVVYVYQSAKAAQDAF